MSDKTKKTSSTDSVLGYYFNKDQSPDSKAPPSTPKGRERQTTTSVSPPKHRPATPSSTSRPATPGPSVSRPATPGSSTSRPATPGVTQRQSPPRAGGTNSSARGSPGRSSVASAAVTQDNINRASDNSFNSLEQELKAEDKGIDAQKTRADNKKKIQTVREEEKKFASGSMSLGAGQTSADRRNTANRRLRNKAEEEEEDAKRGGRKDNEAEAGLREQAKHQQMLDLSIRTGRRSHDRKYKDDKGKGKDTKKE